jgi:hypothetical protein
MNNYEIRTWMASPRKHDLLAELFEVRPSKKRRMAKKTVRFAEDRNTVRSRRASDDDLNTSWLQREEYEKIRADCWATVRAVQSVRGNITGLDVNKVCTRGLEKTICTLVFKGPGGNKRRKITKTILMQHQVEKDLGFSDPDCLRILSQALSKTDQETALIMASIDACSC